MIFKKSQPSHLDKNTNRLIESTSPYLLQHAHNPVNWYPWGVEAFAKARKENKPILLSIGYSTCYWCHVMEREVFEDREIAKIMNDSIISIKVDREERPDIDEIYMTATQLITRGGWPNNVFVTPDLKPFFAGTYFSGSDFSSLIKQIDKAWKEQQKEIEKQSEQLANTIIKIKEQENNNAGGLPSQQTAQLLFEHFSNYYDEKLGGFYQAPKFPNEDALLFLLSFSELKKNAKALEMVKNTLHKMSEGGIFDHIGGGFHRYSTDANWHIPHFEKMLYNQALLGRAYTELYKISGSEIDRDVAEKIYDYVLQLMSDEQGGFYSALDAETDEVEGAYYAWTRSELETALDQKKLAWLDQHYGFANIPKIWGHKNSDGKILYLKQQLTQKDLKQNREVMSDLFAVRSKRKLPHLDDKVITAWNGLMIDSFAKAGIAFQRKDYIESAKKSADFILKNLQKEDGSLYRTFRASKANTDGFFEDYSFMIQGLASLYQASNETKYLEAAKSLAEKSQELFWDKKNGGYFFTDGSEKLLVRMKNAEDSAIPSGNAVMANALFDLYSITGDEKWKNQAEEILKAFALAMQQNPRAYTHMVHALMRDDKVSDRIQIKNYSQKNHESSIETKGYVEVSAPKALISKTKNGIELIVKLKMEKGWHINANKASLSFLIPTSVDVRDDDGKVKIKNIDYPKPKEINTPLGKIDVYEGEISIPIKISLPEKIKNPRILIRAQACKDASCLLPSDWVIPLNY